MEGRRGKARVRRDGEFERWVKRGSFLTDI